MQQELARPRALGRRLGRQQDARRRLPWYGALGLALLTVAWIISWSGFAPFSRYYFFPIWFGYILLVDSVVFTRRGTSLLRADPPAFAALFLESAAFWWAFEALNKPVQNWHYLGAGDFTPLGYFAFASLAFSTVLPGVLETATLIGSCFPATRYLSLARPEPPAGRLLLVAGIGVAALVAPFIWPREAYGFLWISGLLIIEPLNWWAGRPSILRQLAAGRLQLLLTLFGAGICCGLLWEMWNFYAMPKWYYVLPGIQAPKLFEMPLPGFMGYFPFALELYAAYNFVLLITGRTSTFERVLQVPPR